MTEEKVLLVEASTTVAALPSQTLGAKKEGGREVERNREKLCTSQLDKGYGTPFNSCNECNKSFYCVLGMDITLRFLLAMSTTVAALLPEILGTKEEGRERSREK